MIGNMIGEISRALSGIYLSFCRVAAGAADPYRQLSAVNYPYVYDSVKTREDKADGEV